MGIIVTVLWIKGVLTGAEAWATFATALLIGIAGEYLKSLANK